MSPTIVSAPGKVLIAGGYLVLDPTYSGIVVSTSSRFYTAIQTSDSGVQPNNSATGLRVIVRSPQFVGAEWSYAVHFGEGVLPEEVTIEQLGTTKNKFVFIALHRTFQLVLEIKGRSFLTETLAKGLNITIVGGNDFYSQRTQLASRGLPATLASLSQVPPFASTGVPLTEVHKTGLGSSAALITSLVSALLFHFEIIPRESLSPDTKGSDGQISSEVGRTGRYLAHNVAQYIHCLAQGKVGSGFDVSSAVFGSHIYTRFDPAVLQLLMTDSSNEPLFPILSAANPAWNYKIAPFQLPPYTRLMLADVDAGSDTPSLVGKVLKWRQECTEQAHDLWNTLSEANMDLARLFSDLSQLHSSDAASYSNSFTRLATLPFSEWASSSSPGAAGHQVVQALLNTRGKTEDIRSKMRKMGEFSQVPIEPPEQTELLDACISQRGVIGGGVPGAGGYDAIWLLVLDAPNIASVDSPLAAVEKVWTGWTKLDVSPLSATESLEKGARLETAKIPGLSELLE